MALRKEGVWREIAIAPGKRISFKMPDGADLYFAINSFSRKERRKEYCLPSQVLYQDLDWVRPEECPVQPDCWWETSPGRYQGLWLLDQLMEPGEFASYNRALNRACGADPGTWNLTRVLRVPGSWNEKRGCRVSPAYAKSGPKLEVAA